MRKRPANQKGFTLIELLAVVAIVGMLVPVISGSIIQLIRGTDRNNTRVIALADIEHAASWLNQDLLMVQTRPEDGSLTINLVKGAPPVDLAAGANLTLSWTDYYGGNATAHQSRYYLSGTKLMRDYDGQVANIASYISKAEFAIDGSGKIFTMTLTSSRESVWGRSQTKTYRIYRRSE